jgi:hypothetical protein
MTTEENGKPQGQQPSLHPRRRNGYWGPSVLLIIVATLVFFAVNGHESNASDRDASNFDSTAILSGIKRDNNSSTFHGGKASAVMGAVDLDLRNATMEGNEATLEVSSIMGGIDIRVPRTWTVVNHVTPILGGIDDHTHPIDGDTKRLIIEGTVVMGGLDIKN